MIDLYGGSVELFFTGKDGISRNVTNLAFPQSDQTLGSKQYVNFVESVRVKTSILKFTEIEVRFAPPFEQAVNMINSGLMGLGFSGPLSGQKVSTSTENAGASKKSFNFNTISIRLHYGGKKSPWYKGILLAPEVEISSDNIGITCKAVGMLFESTKKSGKNIFEAQTLKGIFESISKDLKDRVEIVFNPNDAKCKDAMSKIENMNQSETDFRSLKEILSKTNCVLIDKGTSGPGGKPLFEVISKDFMRKQKKDIISLVVRENINPNAGIYPILSLSTSLNNYILGQTFGFQASVFSDSTKDSTEASASTIGANTAKDKTDSMPSGDKSISNGPNSPENAKKAIPVSVPSSVGDAMKGLVQEFTDAPLQYVVKTVGIVDLIPGRPINISVKGVKFLSSTYDLYEVEHEFSMSGIETNVTLARTYGLADTIESGVSALQAATTGTQTANTKNSIPIQGNQ